MGSIGRTVRKAFGPYERQVSELYRRIFIDLEDMSRAIRDWSEPTDILEIGCGEGALAERLTRDFPQAHYTGIDIIPHLGRLYEGPADRVQFQQVTAEDLAVQQPGRFDLVVINDVLHHVPDALREGILVAARDLLAPGGKLVFKDWVRRPTPIHAAVYVADVHVGGDKGVRYMPLDEQEALIARVFGAGAVTARRSIAPWGQNLAFLVEKRG
ncbi:class I SAM-dependent methyltransferase [Mesobacterium pallidum]|uniref:class I SAM-dependent methyltransferase n=1 Tax=Mesobacterium pallidum TaxID=2872037 RepID=UPI001EE2837F|nr:class I SAM-dependent methyltransferase [Mesobacterium pallidum]